MSADVWDSWSVPSLCIMWVTYDESPQFTFTRLQESMERELEKYVVRRSPLGIDRLGRRYW